MMTQQKLNEIQGRVMQTAALAGVKPFEDDLALLMIELKMTRSLLSRSEKEEGKLSVQLGEAVALLRESREYAGIEWMVKTDNFLNNTEKPIGMRICGCTGDGHDSDCATYCSDHATLKPCRHCLGNKEF